MGVVVVFFWRLKPGLKVGWGEGVAVLLNRIIGSSSSSSSLPTVKTGIGIVLFVLIPSPKSLSHSIDVTTSFSILAGFYSTSSQLVTGFAEGIILGFNAIDARSKLFRNSKIGVEIE